VNKKNDAVSAAVAAAGDLSGWYGQQIPFNSLSASGVLQKKSDGTYTGANGYTMREFYTFP
jgi:chitinase